MPEVIEIDPCKPDPKQIAKAVTILAEGGIIAYPTETFYGLGADIRISEALERVFSIKGRPIGNPIALIVGDAEDLTEWVEEIPSAAYGLIEALWPGALTIVFRASARTPPRLTGGTGTIGIRVSSHPVASALASTLHSPITATSANISGAGECSTAAEVTRSLGNSIDAVIDGGRTKGEAASTILDMTSNPPSVLREGAIPASHIYAVLDRYREK